MFEPKGLSFYEEECDGKIFYLIVIGKDYEDILLTRFKDKDRYPSIEVEEWLNENITEWFCDGMLYWYEIIFKSKDDAMLFKLSWS